MSTPSPLLQDVLRPQTISGFETIDSKLSAASLSNNATHPNQTSSPRSLNSVLSYDSDDDLMSVISFPGSPVRSTAPSRQSSRQASPTRASGASKRPAPGPLLLPSRRRGQGTSMDPLRAFPADVSQRIFSNLPIRDLAHCARVSKKWFKSQNLNYIWFLHVRKDNFHDEMIPTGKWTRRESKQNWRLIYMQNSIQREKDASGTFFISTQRLSRPASPFSTNMLSYSNMLIATTAAMTGAVSRGSSLPGSGYATPREIREEMWRQESQLREQPSKNEMREMYKELGGRKARAKNKFGGATVRDKGGWDGLENGAV